MRWLVPLVAALVPVLITPGLLSYFDVTPKIAILLLGVALILSYQRGNARNLRALLAGPAGRWLAILLAAEWIASAVATLFSTHPALSINGGNWRRFGFIEETGLLLFVLLAAAWMAAGPDNLRSLLRACTLGGALSAGYGIAQYFGWDPLLPATAYQVGEGAFTIVRPPGTLGHADYFAAWMVAIVFLALALRRMEETAWRRNAAIVTCGLATVAILLSGTRSALLGLFAGAIALALVGRPGIRMRSIAVVRRWISSRFPSLTVGAETVGGETVTEPRPEGAVPARALVLALLATAALAAFYFSPAGAKLRARVYWSRDDARGGARLLLWRDAARMAVERPIAGYGPETFATEFARFESLELARAYPDFYHESPHNIWLDALTTRGIPGLVVLIALCVLGCWAAVRGTRLPRAPAIAAFVGVVVCQQFIVFTIPTALSFFLLIAILAASASKLDNAGPVHVWAVRAALAAALFLAVFAIRLLVADHALAVANRAIAAGDVRGAGESYRVVLKWQPSGFGADLGHSRSMAELSARTPNFAARIDARQQALEAAVRATMSAEDRHNAWYNLAMLLAESNDAPGVERSLRNAIAWSPNWFKPHLALAKLLDVTGHPREALAEAEAAVERNGGHDPEVTETLRAIRRKSGARP